MKLSKILNGIDNLKAKGDLDLEIEGIENNSKNVKKGFLFVAIKGFSVDGHEYINQAIESGAIAIVVEDAAKIKNIDMPENITIIVSQNTREFLALASCNFYRKSIKKV